MIRAKIGLLSSALLLTVSFAMARAHPFGDASAASKVTPAGPMMEHSSVPTNVRNILANKCADCHSLRTRTPIYGRFAPVSWLLERDINLGRQAMNLDEWDRYSVDQQQTLAAKIVQETKSHEMPLLQYRIIHRSTQITDADMGALANWARMQSGSTDNAASTAADGDPDRGKMLFEKRCTGCHELTQNHEGPRLAGIYGRASGSLGDYTYSAALKKSNIVWDDTSLDKWLADPDLLVPGNNMDFLISKPLERRDIIAYLKQTGAS